MSEPINPIVLENLMVDIYRYANGLTPYKLENPVDIVVSSSIEEDVAAVQKLAAEAIEKAVLEVIGNVLYLQSNNDPVQFRKKLRAEQRAKLEQLSKGEPK